MSFRELLNSHCDIQSATRAQSIGGEQQDSYSNLYTNVACRLRDRDVSERLHADKQYLTATHSLYIEHRNFDVSKIRIIANDVIYKVIGSINMGGVGKYLCLYLEGYNV